MHFCAFYKITVEHNFSRWITRGLTYGPEKEVSTEV